MTALEFSSCTRLGKVVSRLCTPPSMEAKEGHGASSAEAVSSEAGGRRLSAPRVEQTGEEPPGNPGPAGPRLHSCHYRPHRQPWAIESLLSCPPGLPGDTEDCGQRQEGPEAVVSGVRLADIKKGACGSHVWVSSGLSADPNSTGTSTGSEKHMQEFWIFPESLRPHIMSGPADFKAPCYDQQSHPQGCCPRLS